MFTKVGKIFVILSLAIFVVFGNVQVLAQAVNRQIYLKSDSGMAVA